MAMTAFVSDAVASGEVEITQNGRYMMTCSRYHFFGEESCLDEIATRPVSVNVKSEATLLFLSREKYVPGSCIACAMRVVRMMHCHCHCFRFLRLVRSGEKWVAPIRSHARGYMVPQEEL
jgi:hypothetical protein